MSQSYRIRSRVLKYSIIFKTVGILNEEEFNRIVSELNKEVFY